MVKQKQAEASTSLSCPVCGEDCILGPGPRDRECAFCDAVFCTLEPIRGWRQATVPGQPGQRTLRRADPAAAGTLWAGPPESDSTGGPWGAIRDTNPPCLYAGPPKEDSAEGSGGAIEDNKSLCWPSQVQIWAGVENQKGTPWSRHKMR